MKKYIDAEKLKRLVGELKGRAKRNHYDSWGIVPDALEEVEGFIDSLQQEQPEKYIELNGIKYRKVPAKTNDKICKDCDYFLDNGTCKLVDCCPCVDDDTILERLQEQPEVDLKNEIITQWSKCNPTDEGMGSEYAIIVVEQFAAIARHFYELGLKAKEDNK